MSKLYLDISHHHRVKNWAELEKNCPFLITKATEGQTFVDSYFPVVVHECEKRKIPYFLYTFLRRGNVKKQINYLVDKVNKVKGSNFIGYCLDIECGNSAKEVQEAVDYLDEIWTGKKLFYYMYSDYGKYKSTIRNLDKRSWCVWEARYGRNTAKYNKSYPPHEIVDLHQYASGVRIPFMTGGIDVNRLTGSKSESWFCTKKKVNAGYFKKCSKEQTSIIAGLKENGYKSNYNYRSLIAQVNNIRNYAGTAKQNIKMLDMLKAGKLAKPL